VPKSQPVVQQGFTPGGGIRKHPIVTFLGRIERSEERSVLSGYDEQVLYRARLCPVAQNPNHNAEGKCQNSNGGLSSRWRRPV